MLTLKPFSHAVCYYHLQSRGLSRGHWMRKHLKDIWHRQVLAGQPEPVPRSFLPNWNYESELFSFGKRLGEDFNVSTLRRAFTNQRVGVDAAEDAQVGILQYASAVAGYASWQSTDVASAETGGMDHNQDLADYGKHVIDQYVLAYLRYHLPNFPEEGISAAHKYLTSVEKMSYIGKHVGVYDLIKPEDVPIPEQLVASTFEAVVGALATDQSEQAAEQFVQDLVLTQLVGYDVNEAWMPVDPMGLLMGMLKRRGMGEPEPRLIRQSGSNTVTPIYLVGIYSDKHLIGEGPGETLLIAEEMAARYALQTLWGTRPSDVLYSYGDKGRSAELSHFESTPNLSIKEMISHEDNVDLSAVTGEETVEEPLDPADALIQHKRDVEGPLGEPIRRRLMHKFHKGSKHRRNRRITNQPKPHLV